MSDIPKAVRGTATTNSRFAAVIDIFAIWLSPALLGLVGAFVLGPDANWDLANYHYYNPWAFLNGRVGHDVPPASMPTFYNPLLDIPVYWANTRLPARLIAFCLALVQGVCISAIYRMARQSLFPRPFAGDALASLAVAFVAITSTGSLFEIATTFYDYVGAVAVAAACALLLPRAAIPIPSVPRVALAGLILGVAVGAKETNLPLAGGIGLAVPLLGYGMRSAAVRFAAFAVGGVAGTLASVGWWALFLWRRFHDPIFPMYNNIFHSPFAPLAVTFDRRWAAHGWFEWLFYPFVLLADPFRGSEFALRDSRLAALLLAVPIGLVVLVATRGRTFGAERAARRRFLLFLLIGLGLAYSLWLIIFAYQRYALALEMMAPLVCALVAAELPWPRWRVPIGAAALASLLATFTVVSWQRGDWRALGGRHLVDVSLPAFGLRGGDLVLFQDVPEAFVAPWFPAGTRFAPLSREIAPSGLFAKFEPQVACLIAAQTGSLFVVLSDRIRRDGWRKSPRPEDYGLSLSMAACRPIDATIHPDGPLYLCPMSRSGPPGVARC
ncbi:MAG TPA: hypothetical protein VID77_13480 [Stellaceae bacterium]|jgi:hypothetical protein